MSITLYYTIIIIEFNSLTLLIVSNTCSVFSHLNNRRLKVVNVTTATNIKIRYAPTVILSHILYK